ncbi:MAG: hypothetical protein Q8N37_01255 [bacterium]|nr:hypothetical protein [bacterium]
MKEKDNFNPSIEKSNKFFNKASQESLHLIILRCLASKKWYSHRKKIWSKEEIVKSINGYAVGIETDKSIKIEEVIRWLVKEDWVEEVIAEIGTDTGQLYKYRITDSGNDLMIFLISISKNKRKF